MTSGAELDAGRHPFVEGAATERLAERRTATTTATATATPDPTTPATATATGTEGRAPGFGVVAALAALAALAVGVRRRQ
jgi:PGF-CTERM protein